MEQWIEIRRRVLGKEISKRAACKEYGVHWDTLKKILSHSEPPGYQRAQAQEAQDRTAAADHPADSGG